MCVIEATDDTRKRVEALEAEVKALKEQVESLRNMDTFTWAVEADDLREQLVHIAGIIKRNVWSDKKLDTFIDAQQQKDIDRAMVSAGEQKEVSDGNDTDQSIVRDSSVVDNGNSGVGRVEDEALTHLREAMAEKQHEIWSHWMKWMLKNGGGMVTVEHPFRNGSAWQMNNGSRHRWQRQMNTPYAELSEEEKQSDRDVVDEHGLVDLIANNRKALVDEVNHLTWERNKHYENACTMNKNWMKERERADDFEEQADKAEKGWGDAKLKIKELEAMLSEDVEKLNTADGRIQELEGLLRDYIEVYSGTAFPANHSAHLVMRRVKDALSKEKGGE